MLQTAGLILPALLIGCSAHQRPELVPASARLQMSGTGREVYTAADDGMVYIYDKSTDHLLWSGQVLRGQTVVVDPQTDQITLNGTIVSNRAPILGSHGIDVYYDPGRFERPAAAAGARMPAPVTSSGDNGGDAGLGHCDPAARDGDTVGDRYAIGSSGDGNAGAESAMS